jgi:hemolysin-activating ACP:hemolysin acyltransferase
MIHRGPFRPYRDNMRIIDIVAPFGGEEEMRENVGRQ